MSAKNSALKDIPDIYQIVYELTAQVPEGMVTTYGSIAEALGDIKAARAVGEIEHLNPRPIIVPCHRVVYADGGLSGFGAPGGAATKEKFLEKEGVRIRDGKIANFQSRLFKEFDVSTPRPLEQLRKLQQELSSKVELKNGFADIDTVCGMDVAYRKRKAVGAAVVIDYNTKEVIEKKSVVCEVNFPYIPTYLAFRELPPIIKLIEKLKTKPTVVMLDGNGILHPRRFGIASHIGVVLDMPFMGAAKKPLCGTYGKTDLKIEGDSTPIKLEEKTVGYAMLSSPRSDKPVFISPGHKISLRTSLTIAKKLTGHRMLAPVRAAHMLATEKAKKINSY